MSIKAPSPEQWQMMHRLRAAGCPLDWKHLERLNWPLKVMARNDGLRSNILPLRHGTGVALFLYLVASASVTISQFRLEAGWLTEPLTWLRPCEEHRGRYCLHLRNGDNLSCSAAKALNWRVYDSGVLKTGAYFRGFLFGKTAAELSLTDEVELEATLWIEDLRTGEQPYAVPIVHRAAAGDMALRLAKVFDAPQSLAEIPDEL